MRCWLYGCSVSAVRCPGSLSLLPLVFPCFSLQDLNLWVFLLADRSEERRVGTEFSDSVIMGGALSGLNNEVECNIGRR